MEKTPELNFLTLLWPFTGILFLIVLGVLLLNRQFHRKLYRQKLEKEKLKAQHRFELLQSTISVQEEERRRIARDLHDELGAALSMTRMHLVQLGGQTAIREAGLNARVEQVQAMAEQALAATRRISHALMPPQLESFGLLQTLEAVAADINRLGPLHAAVGTDGSFLRLPSAIELGVCRIALELINNTIRHAEASRIEIFLAVKRTRLHFRYCDNGKGLPADLPVKGIGLRNIEARTHAMNGTLHMGNRGSGGMQALIEIELDSEHYFFNRIQ